MQTSPILGLVTDSSPSTDILTTFSKLHTVVIIIMDTNKQMLNKYTHHVQNSDHLMENGLGSQLHLANEASQDSSDFKGPPLHTHHDHARNGHPDEHAPVLQTVHGPPWWAESGQQDKQLEQRLLLKLMCSFKSKYLQ